MLFTIVEGLMESSRFADYLCVFRLVPLTFSPYLFISERKGWHCWICRLLQGIQQVFGHTPSHKFESQLMLVPKNVLIKTLEKLLQDSNGYFKLWFSFDSKMEGLVIILSKYTYSHIHLIVNVWEFNALYFLDLHS